MTSVPNSLELCFRTVAARSVIDVPHQKCASSSCCPEPDDECLGSTSERKRACGSVGDFSFFPF